MKKIGLLVIVLLGIFVLSGCTAKGELERVDNIKKEDIFNQEEDMYYVYFHRINCEDCEQSAPRVIEYSIIREEKAGCNEKRKVYAVLLYTKDEKPKDKTHIYREYTGDDGQGTDGKYFVNGVTNWEDLYIASTSSLIAINTNSQGEKVASYIAQGANSVVSHLSAQLGECYS